MRSSREILADAGPPQSIEEAQFRMETWATGLEVVVKDELFWMHSYIREADGRERYNLEHVAGKCGTAGCAGGYVPVIFPQAGITNVNQIRPWFGLTDAARILITEPGCYGKPHTEITRHDAAARIREVAADPASFTL